MRDQRGAATVEWTGLVVVVALVLGGAAAIVPAVDGRSLGALISHALVCAVEGGCDDGDARLADAYGERDAALVRTHAPSLVYERGERQLPVDYRHCRAVRCAEAPDDPALDAHRTSRGGHPATAFTRVIHRGEETYVQYWLYYPDSNSAVLGSDRLWPHSGLAVRLAGRLLTGSWAYPGYHRDDWEGAIPMAQSSGWSPCEARPKRRARGDSNLTPAAPSILFAGRPPRPRLRSRSEPAGVAGRFETSSRS